MAILAFQKPENVIMMDASDTFAHFEFHPLEPGYGITIGNALRRILLSSLEGFAITSIKIDGVDHEFATIPGVLEDVTNIILNLKQIRFKQIVADTNEETFSVLVEKKDVFTAGDLNAQLSAFEVLNPDLVICHLDKSASVNIEFKISKGRGYVPAEENRQANGDLQSIAIDSIYTPIRNVRYWVENFRVEQKTDYEKLLLEVTTDGSIRPQEALREAAIIMIQHLQLFTEENIEVEKSEIGAIDELNAEALRMRQLLKNSLEDFDLSVRAINCLNSGGVYTLGELVRYQKSDLLKFRNFGRKSLNELEELFDTLGLSFGMDISKYKLEKE
ncbi:DNA-directed RNA polymerase subunit alpha [Porphyromonas macacae]|uniref:DNA-directed RNA polymerase subunit alpha n=1 Tax=Porphyromonas macacae TaxID=28115 RepID=A0A0A2E0L2_9PORP|nr:DNA-directed RNA polymerase subunit alpha [Porphyromonas macacae]KGN72438.1 DNA-directed RNA polymerase subunit alpha [Porphyromonas macacae]KGN98730.1 DNA-directed RNA polymerase subunit alpha [Porphyromonas macacae]SUB77059.1 DNA-directed RNA polymerase subunit alpha [Porphyromonas macacae]SUB88562.1 DNA-directed RNA polymerase subunit alpha [Porphyromonas macacae]